MGDASVEVGVEVTRTEHVFEHLFEQLERYTHPPTARQPFARQVVDISLQQRWLPARAPKPRKKVHQ